MDFDYNINEKAARSSSMFQHDTTASTHTHSAKKVKNILKMHFPTYEKQDNENNCFV